jgi:predicted transporter
MLLLVAALYRVLSTVMHGAAFALPSIVIEIIVGLFLIFAGSKISKES